MWDAIDSYYSLDSKLQHSDSGAVVVYFFFVLQHVRVHPCMAEDSGGQFMKRFVCLEMVVGIFHFIFNMW